MRALEFIRGHVIFKLRYNQIYQLKTTLMILSLKPLFWAKKVVIWWLFNDDLRAREREREEKNPEIPRPSSHNVK